MNAKFKKRFESMLWRSVMMSLAVGIDMSLKAFSTVDAPVEVTVIAGLFLGEVSKFLHTEYKK